MYGEIYLKLFADPGATVSAKRPGNLAEGYTRPEGAAFEQEIGAPDPSASAVAEDRDLVEPVTESLRPESAEVDDPEEAAEAVDEDPAESAATAPDHLVRHLEAWSGICASVAEDATPAEGGVPAEGEPVDQSGVLATIIAGSEEPDAAATGEPDEARPGATALAAAPRSGAAGGPQARNAAEAETTGPATDPVLPADATSGGETLRHAGPARAGAAAHLPEPVSAATDHVRLLHAPAGGSGGAVVDSLAFGGAPAALAEARTNPADMVWRPAHAHAPSVIRQIADAVVTTRDSSIEIALSPEELGRVRLVVTGAERAHQVTVWVERPEVMDLVRRNVGLLAEQFGEAGLENASFEFREDRSGRGAAGEGGGTAAQQREDLPDMTALTARMAVSLPGSLLSGDRRLDIRL